MVANTLNVSFDVHLAINFGLGSSLGTLPDNVAAPSAILPSFKRQMSNGAGANKCAIRSIERYSFASGNTDLDLSALPCTRSPGGNLAFALIKLFGLRLVAPTTGVKLVIGNYGANGWVGFLRANNVPLDIEDQIWQLNQIDGWAANNSTLRYLRINNPGGSAVAADLILVGE